MNPFRTLRSRVVPLDLDDVDTDQIIPARFLKVTTKEGLGDALFADWRARPGFPIGRPEHAGAEVLLAGRNFGCGSSREHAPWALAGAGLRAVVARSFGDIFRSNALKNGLLPVALDDASHAELAAAIAADPRAEIVVDLEAERVRLPSGREAAFAIDPFSRDCLLAGLDELGYLLSYEADIAAHERRTEAR
jgi:3-isopropylmalate/(R)-2-methylmalate dehydratase small subunit